VQEGSKKAVAAAAIANGGLAVAKLVGFAITGAASLLAEGIHSIADTGNQGLLFLGGARAGKAADARHPFGYGRERYFWSFVVSMVLFSLGGLFALYEGIEKLRHPHAIESPLIAVAILLVGVALEIYSFRTAIREAKHVKRTDESWWKFIRHAKSPELPVVLLEDMGALVGLLFALTGIGLAELTGEERFDAMGSVAIGALLVVIAITLAIEMKSLLVGEGASPESETAIRNAMEGAPSVRRVIHMRTLHLGPDELLVAAKLDVDAPSVEAAARAIDDVEARIRAAVPIARVIYLEPDLYREDPASSVEPA
jgi:cation diffusion facilitator family transporter